MSRFRRRRGGSGSLLVVLVLVVVVLVLRGGKATPSARVAERPRAHEDRDVVRVKHEREVRSAGFGADGVPVAALGGLRSSVHVALGVPVDRDPSDDTLMDEREYVLSYNPNLHVPNWVAWKLNASYLGHVRRMNDFRPDERLPDNLYHVTPRDYVRSGYDRGHMCPSADRTRSEEENAVTFLMSNMQPQLHELNAGPWEKLEDYERAYAERTGQDLYIVAGGEFDEHPATIGRGVAVPRANFKIIVAVPHGALVEGVTASTTAVAVVMPNEPGVGGHEWPEYLTTVDRVEADTGYDFLSSVPVGVQAVIESSVASVAALR